MSTDYSILQLVLLFFSKSPIDVSRFQDLFSKYFTIIRSIVEYST